MSTSTETRLREQLERLRDSGYQPMYNGRSSCPFCLNFVDDEETHAPGCVLVAALASPRSDGEPSTEGPQHDPIIMAGKVVGCSCGRKMRHGDSWVVHSTKPAPPPQVPRVSTQRRIPGTNLPAVASDRSLEAQIIGNTRPHAKDKVLAALHDYRKAVEREARAASPSGERASAQAAELAEALERVAPADPMSQDEMGGCVWCGGTPRNKPYGYATAHPSSHMPDCDWLNARRVLAAYAREENA